MCGGMEESLHAPRGLHLDVLARTEGTQGMNKNLSP